MTAHTPRILTEAETALIAAFETAGFADAVEARAAAIESLKESGLPTRRVEAFHYTDLRALMAAGYTLAKRPTDEIAQSSGDAFPRLVSDAAVLHFRDGHYFDRGEELPDGVSVVAELPEAPAVTNGAADAVAAINTAFSIGGTTVTVAPNADVARTVGLAHAQTGAADTLGAIRNAIHVGKGAKCSFVDRGVGPNGVRYLFSSHTDLVLEEGADVSFVMSIEEGDAAQRLSRLNVTLHKDAKLNLFLLNAGGKLVRQEIEFDFMGEGADLNIAGINLIGGEAHIDVTSRITHHVPNTTATETFRNVATGRGRGVFQGQINVRQAAQLTDARMACNTLLLSDDCDFSAKPELEIFADDVQCAHGATVADLEKSYLFYLRARGISEVTARRMLVKAFVAEVLENVGDEALAERLEGIIDVWMGQHV